MDRFRVVTSERREERGEGRERGEREREKWKKDAKKQKQKERGEKKKIVLKHFSGKRSLGMDPGPPLSQNTTWKVGLEEPKQQQQ